MKAERATRSALLHTFNLLLHVLYKISRSLTLSTCTYIPAAKKKKIFRVGHIFSWPAPSLHEPEYRYPGPNHLVSKQTFPSTPAPRSLPTVLKPFRYTYFYRIADRGSRL